MSATLYDRHDQQLRDPDSQTLLADVTMIITSTSPGVLSTTGNTAAIIAESGSSEFPGTCCFWTFLSCFFGVALF